MKFCKKKLLVILFSFFLFLLFYESAVHSAEYRLMSDPLPPFNFKSETGKVRGISADTLIAILNRAGIRASYQDIEILPWPRAHYIAEKGPKAVLFSAARTSARENLFKWAGPIYPITIGLIASKSSNITISEPADLKKYRIAAVRKSAPEQLFLKKLGLSAKALTQVAAPDQLISMFKHGRLDIIVHTDISAAYLLSAHGLDPEQFEMILPLKTLDLYFAFSPDTPDALLNRLQKELDRMKTPHPDRPSEFETLFKRYLTGTILTP